MRGGSVRAQRLAVLGLAGALAWASSQSARADGYNGVAPGSNKVPDNIAAPPGGPALVTWPGFQMLPNGGSRVFIQTSVAVKPSLRRDGSTLEIVLPSVSLPPGNARRPLDTSFFNTPVLSIRARPHRGGVVVSIELRSRVSPALSTERAQNGYFFVVVDFPPGDYR